MKPLILDGKKLAGKRFVNRKIVYCGGQADIHDCTFSSCTYEFRGPAANVILLLKHINQSPGGRKIIRLTFPGKAKARAAPACHQP